MISFLAGWYRKRALDNRSFLVIRRLEEIFGMRVNYPEIYLRALRHRSKLIESNFADYESYEQLEFLGDAVLDMVVTEIIFKRFPRTNEGFMTQVRSRIVKGETLALFTEKLGLNEILEVGSRVQGQGIQTSSNVMADIFEAVIGALYQEKGYKAVFTFISKVIHDEIDFDFISSDRDNYKSILLEYMQAQKTAIPVYEVLKTTGPDHDREYEIQVRLDGDITGKGIAKNKKKAEQIAAREALVKMKVI